MVPMVIWYCVIFTLIPAYFLDQFKKIELKCRNNLYAGYRHRLYSGYFFESYSWNHKEKSLPNVNAIWASKWFNVKLDIRIFKMYSVHLFSYFQMFSTNCAHIRLSTVERLLAPTDCTLMVFIRLMISSSFQLLKALVAFQRHKTNNEDVRIAKFGSWTKLQSNKNINIHFLNAMHEKW